MAGSGTWGAPALPIPSSGIYLGIWSADSAIVAGTQQSIDVREGPPPNGVSRVFNLHLIYIDWGAIPQQLISNGAFQPAGAFAGDISHGRVPVISWKCDKTVANSDHVIAGGDAGEDAVITAAAQALRQYPGPVLLRWFWEFNQLNKNQGCRGDTGGKPTAQVYADFIGAWIHIYNLFQSAGATNVVFLWNPVDYNENGPDDPHNYYPGNNYVDWIGVDAYQRTAETFDSDFGQFYQDFSQSQYGGKPIIVGENGAPNFSVGNAELQAAYLQDAAAQITANRYPLLKAYDYFDGQGVDAAGNSDDWILDDNNGHGNGGLAAFAAIAASAFFSPAPVLTAGSVANGATYVSGGLVPGSWAQVKGSLLGNVTRIWAAQDFAGLGKALPAGLSGVQVKVNNMPAAVYYVDQGQIDFQVPNGVSGNASIQVTVSGIASNVVTGAVAGNAPGLFPNSVNGVNYPAAIFADGKYVGDPSIGPLYRKAIPGDVIQLYATGLVAEPAGVLPAVQGVSGVTVTIGSVTVPADYAGLTQYAGEFQINFTVPRQFAAMAPGNYPISIAVSGVSSPATINSSPPGAVVVPITH